MSTLSNAHKAQIRLYLGYPDLFKYKNTRLESVISDSVLSSEAQDLIISALNSLAVVESFILGTAIQMGGLKRVDDVEFFSGKTTKEIRHYGKMYVSRISITLGVPVYSDVFGTKGYLGDTFSGLLGNKPHGGNLTPLG